ncbi:Arginyl-tRNA--protein transferase 1 [Tilletia horrida]|nr:Arginyl-tRNA--protein transferase 1 [Tilletia horrida]
MQYSIVAPAGASSSTCGYCSPPGVRSSTKSSKSFYLFSYALEPAAYQALIDAGWRRSCNVIYKPDNSQTCCPQHTIRLLVHTHNTSRSQRRALQPLFWEVHAPQGNTRPLKKRGDDNQPFRLETFWRHTEWSSEHDQDGNVGSDHARPLSQDNKVKSAWYRCPKRRKLEITLRPASVTTEKFQLFKKYQMGVHKEPASKNTMTSWKRFLVSNSFIGQDELEQMGSIDLDSDDPIPYGGYHHEWRLDGKLIAVGVLDILPSCVSSVYSYYDPDLEHLNLGKATALREIYLVQQLGKKRGMHALQYYYLGYWVAKCQKMVYKASYRPQMILDTATGLWHRLEDVQTVIEKGVHYDFLSRAPPDSDHSSSQHSEPAMDSAMEGIDDDDTHDPADSSDVDDSDGEEDEAEPFSTALSEPLPPGFSNPSSISESALAQTLILIQSNLWGSKLVRLGNTNLASLPEKLESVKAALCALGPLAQLFAFVS